MRLEPAQLLDLATAWVGQSSVGPWVNFTSTTTAGVIDIARVVMHTKERLAALIPSGAALVLNTIRWVGEVRPLAKLKPAEGKTAAGLKPGELKMASQLISDMTGPGSRTTTPTSSARPFWCL